MICRWGLELMARKSTRQALSVGQFEWEHNFFLDFLLSVAQSLFCIPAGVVPVVPATSSHIAEIHTSSKLFYLSIPWRPPSWPSLHRYSVDLLTTSCPPGPQILFDKLFSRQPDSVGTWGYSVPEAGLCTWPYPILSLPQFNSIQAICSNNNLP